MEIVIRGDHITAEEKPSLRAAFEDMTRKMIADVMKYGATAQYVKADFVKEIRENVRALGGFL